MVAKRSHHPPLHREGRFAVCLSWYFIAWNRIKQFAYSISQSADADSSLYQREPCYSLGLKCWFAIKQVYQREPCNSFGLKCWFTTEQVQEREPVLLKLWVYRFSINPHGVRWTLTPPSLAQGGQICGLFDWLFRKGQGIWNLLFWQPRLCWWEVQVQS